MLDYFGSPQILILNSLSFEVLVDPEGHLMSTMSCISRIWCRSQLVFIWIELKLG